MGNLFLAGTGNVFVDFLTNQTAGIIYLFILLTGVVIAVISLIKSDKKFAQLDEQVDKAIDFKKILNEAMNSSQQEENAEEGEVLRFARLNEIDSGKMDMAKKRFDENISLKEICVNFRNYAAYEKGLYYNESIIRQFIAGLGVSKILIMQGISGTGKTSIANAFGDFLSNSSLIIPVQPMWKERTDLLGYYNEFTKKYKVTDLLEGMYKANYSNDMFITVLDEMNVARVEYYFAEFLSMLEIADEDKRNLMVISEVWPNDPKLLVGGRIKVPNNMWYIGTANNDDSTFSIADKVYDRAMVMNLDEKAEPFEAPMTSGNNVSIYHWNELVASAYEEYEITSVNLRRINELSKYMIKTYQLSFGNRIMKQIRQYVSLMIACGGEEIEAIDDIIAKKVLRKLESCNPILVKKTTTEFAQFFDMTFGDGKMKSCKNYLYRLSKSV